MVEVTIVDRGDILIIVLPKTTGLTMMVVNNIGPNAYSGVVYSVNRIHASQEAQNTKHGIKPQGLVDVKLIRERSGAVTLIYNSGLTKVKLFGLPAEEDVSQTQFQMEPLD